MKVPSNNQLSAALSKRLGSCIDIPVVEVTSSSMPQIAQGADSSETLARALHEKVSALILLSLEGHILEENVHTAVQETVELQRNLQLVTEQKVKPLLELERLNSRVSAITKV